jgi:shikimate kinase
MMGSGKTTIGQLLAKDVGYGFVDTDAVIEQVAGQSIPEIFAKSGEEAFRQLETQVLKQVAANVRLAIATGGGIVLKRENWSYLHHGLTIWLDVPVDLLCIRLKDDTNRPLLQDTDLRQKLHSILEQRQPLYAQADIRINVTPDESPAAIGSRILKEIRQTIKQEAIPPTGPYTT